MHDPAARPVRPHRAARWALLALVSVVPFVALGPVDYATRARWTDLWTVLVGVSALATPYVACRLGLVDPRGARILFLGAAVLGIFVAVTGIFNGQTFEGITTPRYAGLLLAGQNPYSTLLQFQFTLCAGPSAGGLIVCTTHLSSTYYVYLPLLTFAQIPGLPYVASALAAWGGMVYLVRDRPWAVFALGNPFVALIAANGYNDFPALVVLTLGFVATVPWVRTAARWLGLGFKQFANAVLFFYYLMRQEYRNAALAVLVTAAFLAPFALSAPRAVACTALLHETAGCLPGPGSDLLSHLNYWVWPLWIVALFPDQVRVRVSALRRRFFGFPSAPPRT